MGLLSYEEPFCHIVGSVTRLYRSCSIRDTGMMIIEEKEEEGTGNSDRGRSESNQKKQNLGEVPEEKRRRKMREGRERCTEGEGRTGKMHEEGNKEKRSKRVGSWRFRAVTIDETREKERPRVGIKWGGLLISLAIHPWSVAQDYPRVLPRLIQHYEYFLLVVGVTPAA